MWGWQATKTVSPTWGTCYGLLTHHCSDLPLHGLEDSSQLSFPARTVVVDSSSTGPGITGNGELNAELKVPKGSASPVPKQSALPPGYRVPDDVKIARSRGYKSVTYFVGNLHGGGYLAAVQGIDRGHNTIVFLRISIEGHS